MSLASDLSALSTELISEFGALATYYRQSVGTFDPATETVSDASTGELVSVVLASANDSRRGGSVVAAGSIVAYMAGSNGIVPAMGDRIVMPDGRSYKVSSSSATYVNSTTVIYALGLSQ